MRSREYANFLWFQYLYQTWGSDEAIVDLLRSGPTSGDVDDQEEFLRSVSGMADLHHGFARAVTTVDILDRSGQLYGQQPNWSLVTVAEGHRVYSEQVDPFATTRWQFEVPAGKVATVALVAGEKLQVSHQADLGDWAPLTTEAADWPAECDSAATYHIVASGTEERSTVKVDLAVDDLPEEDCDTGEAIDSSPDVGPAGAECLVGEWVLPLSVLRQTLIADAVEGQKIGSVSGTMTMSLNADGTMPSDINWLRVRSLAPLGDDPDRVLTTMVWDGGGSGTWQADNTSFTTTTSDFDLTFHIVSRLDGSVMAEESREVSADQAAAFSSVGTARYACSEDRLVTQGAGQRAFTWVRANKANTIPKG